jgi:PKD repeat protein
MITVYPAIDATFTADNTTICHGGSILFTATSGAGSYAWDFGDGVVNPSGGYSESHIYLNAGSAPLTRTVSLTTTSFYGCVDTKTLDVTIMPVPAPSFTALPAIQVFNIAGNPVTITNTNLPGTWTYTWDFGDGTGTVTGANPAPHNYTDVGTYDIVLVVDNVTCSATVTHQVRVTPPAPVASFDSIPGACAPLEFTTNNTSINRDVPGTTFLWEISDGSSFTSENFTYRFTTDGLFTIKLTVSGPGGSDSESHAVYVYESPRAAFDVTPKLVYVNDQQVRCFNLSDKVSMTDTYLWDFGDGDTSRAYEPYHKYMEEGVYDITLWAYSENGCSDSYTMSPAVTVEPPGEVRFSNVFTPNKTGPIDLDELPTGGNEIDQFFFPPIREKVTSYKLQIFNRQGVLIFESRSINKPWNGYYKGQLCPQGVYVWYVEGKYMNGQPFKKVGDVTLLH